MIKHANKILYVGAGLHIMPVTHFPQTKQFIFIDSQPRSEFDSTHPKFYNGFYRPHFVNDLVATCQHYGFILDSYTILDKKYYKNIISNKWYYSSWFYKIPTDINPTVLVFTNKRTKQTIRYYISTNIRFNMNNILENDIATSDGIIVSGYFPEIEILQYFIRPKVFFGYTNTCYNISSSFSSDNENTIIYFLHKCICNRQYYFIEFYMVYDDSGVIIKCEDFNSFLDNIKEHDKLVLEQMNQDDTDDSLLDN